MGELPDKKINLFKCQKTNYCTVTLSPQVGKACPHAFTRGKLEKQIEN